MRALSLTQPWATLAAIGAKRLETRSWPTYYRGALLIHAAKGFPRAARDIARRPRFARALEKVGIEHPDQLPLGKIVGIVTLTACISTDQALIGIGDDELLFGNFGPGRFAWQLTEPVTLLEPIPCRGALGLWRVPDPDIEEMLKARFGERVA